MNELAVPATSALRELALFAGAGGGLLGSRWLGWRTVCAVEIDPYRQAVLLTRQPVRLRPASWPWAAASLIRKDLQQKVEA